MSPAGNHAAHAAQLALWQRLWSILLAPDDERQQAAPEPPPINRETADAATSTASETRPR